MVGWCVAALCRESGQPSQVAPPTVLSPALSAVGVARRQQAPVPVGGVAGGPTSNGGVLLPVEGGVDMEVDGEDGEGAGDDIPITDPFIIS